MFGKCEKCKVLESEVNFLRQEVRRLMDRMLAVTQPSAFHSVQLPSHYKPDDFYGNDDEDNIVYGTYGEKLVLKKKEQ